MPSSQVVGLVNKINVLLLRGVRAATSTLARETLPSVRFNDNDQERVLYTLPSTAQVSLPSVLAFALPKSGSVLLHSLLRDVSNHLRIPFVDILGEYFRLGLPIEHHPPETSCLFLPKGYCYGIFRYLPDFDIPIIGTAPSVLLVRDPRDMLVSHYFSMRYSHRDPGNKLKSFKRNLPMRDLARRSEIDDYVKEAAESFRACLETYRTRLCIRPNVKVFQYEDGVYRKGEFLMDVSDHFGWPISRDVCSVIARAHNVIPAAEDINKHVRQVHPGNYLKKLKPDTIRWLDEFFREELRFFKYATISQV